jgi:hypothetical protein
MVRLPNLRGHARRRCMKLLRRVLSDYQPVFVHRDECGFRDAERLHRAGLVTAVMTKPNWGWIMGHGGRPFRELALYARESEARSDGRPVMIRVGVR